MVDLSRLELPTSRLSGVRSNLLSYRSIYKIKWQGLQDLNPWHPVLETDVLPTELNPYFNLMSIKKEIFWCPEAESNHRHGDFQSPALPTELSGHIWRRRRDLNPRIPFERIYSLSRGASSATWVLLQKVILTFLFGGEEGIRTLVSRKTLTVFKTAPLWPLRYLSILGDPSEIRTPDTLIKSQVLYRLS